MAAITKTATGGIRLQMSVPGAKSVDVELSRFGEAISDFRPFFRDYAAPLIFERIQENFDTEGARWVGRWSPLSPAYKLWKVKQVGPKPILQFSGRLKNSLTWNGTSAGPEGIARITETRAEFGTSVPYAIAHQMGAVRTGRSGGSQLALPGLKSKGRKARPSQATGGGLPKRQIIKLPESETMGRLLHRFVIDQKRKTLASASAQTA